MLHSYLLPAGLALATFSAAAQATAPSRAPDSLFVRQREGQLEEMTPALPPAAGKRARPTPGPAAPHDESTDTYDTIEWLLHNVPGNNGKAGLLGISYPGFYATASLPNAHPALSRWWKSAA